MRSRNIKPAFFINEDIASLPPLARLFFIGLWCAADRDGRLEDRPLKLKAQVLPFDSAANVPEYIDHLVRLGLLVRYEVDGSKYLQIINFTKHQNPHHTEKKSALPAFHRELTVSSPEVHGSSTVDILLIPDSLIPDSCEPPSPSPSLRSGESDSPKGDSPAQAKPVKRRQSKTPPIGERLYRWDEFAAAYPAFRMVHSVKARKEWDTQVPVGSDAKVDEILAGLMAWVESEEWQDGIVPNPYNFLSGKQWQCPAPQPRRSKGTAGAADWQQLIQSEA